jgi:hypothetical protein
LQVRYDDSFGVDHYIPAERMTVAWAARRAFWEGVSRVRIHEELGTPLPASMNPAKLLASLPVLCALSRLKPDYRIRRSMAWGSLWAQFRT